MPIRDPAIAQAANSLAEAFRPPTGADAFGFARAGQQVMQNRSLADFYRLSQDPNATEQQREEAAIRAGVYTPNQSFSAQRMQNDTLRANNAADNARAFAQTRYGAVAPNQLLPELPASVASMYGLPASGVVQGNAVLNQGERSIAPDGTVREGMAKPLSQTEWEAQQSERLRQNGVLTDDALKARVMGNTPTTTVAGPDGKPVLQFTANAVGKQVLPDAKDVLNTEEGMRKEILNLPSYKNYAQALPIYQSMLDTADTDSRASDLNLVYGLGKIMDPTSVVREGEMIMARNTAALPDWVVGAINQVNGGAALLPETRAAILKEAYSRAKAYEDALATDFQFYRGIAGRRNIPEQNIIPQTRPFQPYTPKTAGVAPAAPAAQAQPAPVNPIDAELARRAQQGGR